MSEIMRPILEIAVIIPGMLLAYLPVKACLRQAPFKLGLMDVSAAFGNQPVRRYCLLLFSDYDYFVFDSCIAVSHAALS